MRPVQPGAIVWGEAQNKEDLAREPRTHSWRPENSACVLPVWRKPLCCEATPNCALRLPAKNLSLKPHDSCCRKGGIRCSLRGLCCVNNAVKMRRLTSSIDFKYAQSLSLTRARAARCESDIADCLPGQFPHSAMAVSEPLVVCCRAQLRHLKHCF